VSRRTALLVAGLLVALAVPASASTPGPKLPNPTDCHSMNEFLHIDNVRDCDGNDY
jgi:hypothetical protein